MLVVCLCLHYNTSQVLGLGLVGHGLGLVGHVLDSITVDNFTQQVTTQLSDIHSLLKKSSLDLSMR